MPYISSGQVLDSRPRSFWSLSFLPELFWGAVNFVVLFFKTIYDPNCNSRGASYTTDYRASGRGPDPFGPGGRPQRRIGGFRGGRGGPSCPPMGGGG